MQKLKKQSKLFDEKHEKLRCFSLPLYKKGQGSLLLEHIKQAVNQ